MPNIPNISDIDPERLLLVKKNMQTKGGKGKTWIQLVLAGRLGSWR